MRRPKALLLFPLLAAAAQGDTFLLRSTDGGQTWSDIDPGPPHHQLVGVAAGNPLYAATNIWDGGSRLVATSDRGQNWRDLGLLNGDSRTITAAADPSNPDVFYLHRGAPGSDTTIVKITNGGAAVVEYPASGFPKFAVTYYPAIAQSDFIDSDQYDLIVAGSFLWSSRCTYVLFSDTPCEYWQSRDEGHTWSYPKFQDGYGVSIFSQPGSSTPVLFRVGFQFERSEDEGASWTKINLSGAANSGCRPSSLGQDPSNAAVLYAVCFGQAGSTIYQSTDAGLSWNQIPGSDVPPIDSLQVSSANSSCFYARSGADLWRSLDGGRSWIKRGSLPSGILRLDHDDPDTLYLWSHTRSQVRFKDRQIFARSVADTPYIAPGALVTISGSDLAPRVQSAGPPPLPTSLLGASIRINGRPVPIFSVSPTQISAMVPIGIPPGPAAMELQRSNGEIDRQTVTLWPAAPVILTDPPIGKGTPLVFHEAGMRRVTSGDPIRPGETIVIRCAGLGELTPDVQARLGIQLFPGFLEFPFLTYILFYNRKPFTATVAPGEVGIYQVRVGVYDNSDGAPEYNGYAITLLWSSNGQSIFSNGIRVPARP